MLFVRSHYTTTVIRILFIVSMVLQSKLVLASSETEDNSQANKAADFIAATLIKRDHAEYPLSEAKTYNSGSVLLAFMVDKNGYTFEPVVINSTQKAFELPAITALENYKFIPATLNGQPVESLQQVRILFLVDKHDDQVLEQFNQHHLAAIDELKEPEPNKDELLQHIKAMESSTYLSPYLHSSLNIIKQNYAHKFAAKEEQIQAIEQLLLFETNTSEEANQLDLKLRISMRRKLVLLYIQTQQYGSAIHAFEKLNKIDSQANALFGDALEQIDELYQSDQIIQTPFSLSEAGYTTINLFKNNFGFNKNSIEIDRVKLRCDKKFASLGYQKDLEYKIPKSWGRCNLQVIGTPNATSSLYQF